MNKDKLSDVLAIAEIMDILNKSGADIPKSVFSFLAKSLLKTLKETEFIAPQYDDLSDEEKAEVDKIVNKMMGRG
jgi:hypothetical protein